MSKNKKILMMLAKGGMSQSDIASALHVSKRGVSAGAKAIREHGLTFDAVNGMDAGAVDDLFFPKKGREPDDAYLQQDMGPLVERKKRNRKLPVKLLRLEYCERAESEGKLAYSYQMFARLFAEEAKKTGGDQALRPRAKGQRCRLPHGQAYRGHGQGVRDGRLASLLGQALGGGLLRHEAEVVAGRPDARV